MTPRARTYQRLIAALDDEMLADAFVHGPYGKSGLPAEFWKSSEFCAFLNAEGHKRKMLSKNGEVRIRHARAN